MTKCIIQSFYQLADMLATLKNHARPTGKVVVVEMELTLVRGMDSRGGLCLGCSGFWCHLDELKNVLNGYG